MSYIRTKDGVYKIDEVKPYFLDEKQKLFINNELKIAVNEEQVINQSENLDELCDGFYIDFVNYKGFDKDKIGEPYTFEEFRDCFMAYREYEGNSYTHCEGYGFIKTNKGLIYVAKMNENGELCLL